MREERPVGHVREEPPGTERALAPRGLEQRRRAFEAGGVDGRRRRRRVVEQREKQEQARRHLASVTPDGLLRQGDRLRQVHALHPDDALRGPRAPRAASWLPRTPRASRRPWHRPLCPTPRLRPLPRRRSRRGAARRRHARKLRAPAAESRLASFEPASSSTTARGWLRAETSRPATATASAKRRSSGTPGGKTCVMSQRKPTSPREKSSVRGNSSKRVPECSCTSGKVHWNRARWPLLRGAASARPAEGNRARSHGRRAVPLHELRERSARGLVENDRDLAGSLLRRDDFHGARRSRETSRPSPFRGAASSSRRGRARPSARPASGRD